MKLTVEDFVLEALRELAESHHGLRALYRRGATFIEGEHASAYARHEKAAARLETIAVGLFPRPRRTKLDAKRARKRLLKAAREYLAATEPVPS